MRFRFLIPVLTFSGIAAVMWYALFNLNPTEIPTELVSKPAPEFALEPVPGYGPGLAQTDLATGKVVLLNVFASWCVACMAEHPFFMELKTQDTVDIYGLNYKDTPEAAAQWLARHGNPYKRTGMDLKGRVGIDFGVYGVPETFIISPDGKILDKIIGPVSRDMFESRILPLLNEAGS
ncbi:DsbE family thiol:disulfide interchange protein [Sneathiella sp. HT1-7]|jgi:cytochrome c biogenesis protein CcmG/thiol:disulfide interchange protein DsbE|uniref:DsbE family thiol:disulfide interchange protein n=1 Tax=Sneathiella sp. HT1-7 TaxID=2887192 RepID=UPI001D152AB3|nr:DsbE family thiol:disulfide interchange protein [Sneathiella sp. HT1-7]MCC3303663.1 DsbE family thiol:disulfide interchange protein [Sneathiella sp. HT1-7]